MESVSFGGFGSRGWEGFGFGGFRVESPRFRVELRRGVSHRVLGFMLASERDF